MSEDILDRYPLLFESYSKSPEMQVSAALKETKIIGVLWKVEDTTEVERAEGKTYDVPTKINVKVQLQTAVGGAVPAGKTIKFYHRLNTGAWETLGTKTTDAQSLAVWTYTMTAAGTHTFYAEFAGDAEWAGCAKALGLHAVR